MGFGTPVQYLRKYYKVPRNLIGFIRHLFFSNAAYVYGQPEIRIDAALEWLISVPSIIMTY